ncbi:MAG: carbon starvation protein A [Pyrobaculum sp.]
MYVFVIFLIVLAIYLLAYFLYGKRILERRVVKADPNRLTPAVEKFDGVDYVPANKYVLYGHHFASIAGAGPIVGPATAMVWGWGLPLIWVLFGNVFIGAVHDYLAMMASVRHGGVSIMTVSENVMGRRARYIFLAYVWFALILVLAAFTSVASSVFVSTPTAATLSLIYMPLALFFGLLVYRFGVRISYATLVTLVLIILAIFYSLNYPTYLTYEAWAVILAFYSFLAAGLPVWYLLQPRDYLNAYLLWAFVGVALFTSVLTFDLALQGPIYTKFAVSGAVIGALPGTTPAKMDIAYFWPVVPLVIACGALSGFHSVVASGTTSKQLANELDALFVGFGAMLTEGAVSSLAVILPIAVAWNFASLQAATGLPVLEALSKGGVDVSKMTEIIQLGAVDRFTNGYGLAVATALSRIFGPSQYIDIFLGFKTFAAWALSAFILTTLDTANRLARFAWREMFDWLEDRSRTTYKILTNRWVASAIPPILALILAYPKIDVVVPETGAKLSVYAYSMLWPAFSGTNQLLAALALLTGALWVYFVLGVRGRISWLILAPALFLWLTVTAALVMWLVFIMPYLPVLYQAGAGTIIVISLILDIMLIMLFVKAFRKSV